MDANLKLKTKYFMPKLKNTYKKSIKNNKKIEIKKNSWMCCVYIFLEPVNGRGSLSPRAVRDRRQRRAVLGRVSLHV